MDNVITRKPLLEYLPPMMRKFKEMQEIMHTEDVELDNTADNVQRVFNNAFIADCDETGIQKYEALLKITPDSQATLQERKDKVLIRWNEFAPFTYRVLVRMLTVLCGANGFTIKCDLERYSLMVRIPVTHKNVKEEICNMLDRIMPLNMMFEVDFLYKTYGEIASNYKTYGRMHQRTHRQLKEGVD